MKKWFRGSKPQDVDPRADIEDLITLGELDEAERLLRHRLKNNARDIYSRLRLADVLMKLKRQREAFDEYLIAAESYAHDGFFDKASALLRKIEKIAPANEQIALKIEALQKAKSLERRRDQIVTSLLEGDFRGERPGGRSTLQLQQLWTDLCKCPIIDAMTDDQVLRLAAATDTVRLREGEVLVQAGETREEILILARGVIEAKVTLKSGIETTIRGFTAGDLIGDRALLEHKSWPAKYVAVKRTTALTLNAEGLPRLLAGETDPKGLLDRLRLQRNDHQVISALREVTLQD